MSKFKEELEQHLLDTTLIRNFNPESKLKYKQQLQMVYNLNATLVAVLMNEVCDKVQMNVQQVILGDHLVFVIDERPYSLTSSEATKIKANTMTLKGLLMPFILGKKQIDESVINTNLSTDCNTLYIKFKL